MLQEIKKEEGLHFSLVGKSKVILTFTNLYDFHTEVRIFLDDYADIIVDELPNDLPPVGSISHHIELIPFITTVIIGSITYFHNQPEVKIKKEAGKKTAN